MKVVAFLTEVLDVGKLGLEISASALVLALVN